MKVMLDSITFDPPTLIIYTLIFDFQKLKTPMYDTTTFYTSDV